jgi:ABC-2 type transport system ATP-binding protein
MINHGQVVLDESIKYLKYNYLNQKLISVRYQEPVTLRLPGVTVVKEDRNESGLSYAAKLRVDTQTRNLAEVIAQLLGQGAVADITISDRPLEEIIAAIYTKAGPAGKEERP